MTTGTGVGKKVKQQAKQLVKDVTTEVLKEPGRLTETAAKQVGVRSEQPPDPGMVSRKSPAQIEEMKQVEGARRQATMKKLRSELEQEIKRVRVVKEQLQEQKEAVEVQEKQAEMEEVAKAGGEVAQPTTKPEKGLKARLGKVSRQKTERAGGRRSG